MLKRDLEARIYQLEQELGYITNKAERQAHEAAQKLAQVTAERDALKTGGFVERGCHRYAPVALTSEQHDSIHKEVEDLVGSTFGNGTMVSGSYETYGIYEDWFEESDLLPGYGGVFARGSYDNNSGFSLQQIYGLIRIPRPCGCCKKPTLAGYNCTECMAESDRRMAELEAEYSKPLPS